MALKLLQRTGTELPWPQATQRNISASFFSAHNRRIAGSSQGLCKEQLKATAWSLL